MSKLSLLFYSLLTFSTALPLHAVTPDHEAPAVVQAAVAPQIIRFTTWMDIIDRDLVGTPHEIADLLVAHSARASAFNIQALGRLYEDQDPMFATLHKKFKKLEDAIGDYQKWNDLVKQGQESGVSAAVLERLILNRETERAEFEAALVATQFVPVDGVTVPYMQQLREQLHAYPWKDIASDRIDMKLKLIGELESIKSARYDFSRLEEGNGVHEFRRKMRWFSMEARGLNGLIGFKPEGAPCPVAAYASLVNDPIAKTKYAVLPPSPSEPNPIQISACLYVKVAQLIEEVNWIKAKVELQDSFSETAPTDLVSIEDQKLLEAKLSDIIENDLFGLLQAELAAD